MMKRRISLLLSAALMVCGAAGCGKQPPAAASSAAPGWLQSGQTGTQTASRTPAGPQLSKTVDISPQTVRPVGRTMTMGEEERLYFNWSCSGFEFTFTGTGAAAVLGTMNTFIAQETMRPHIAVYVDGETKPRTRFSLQSACASYTLAENLPEGRHTLRVMKISAASYSGYCYAESLTLTGQDPAVAPSAAPSRRIEFVGDSITCGYGVLAKQAAGNYTAAEEDASLSYAYRTALKLDAEAQLVCISGNGVYCDLKGRQSDLMPDYYPYTDMRLQKDHGVSALTPWAFADQPSDAVVVLLGANDAEAVLNIQAGIAGKARPSPSGWRGSRRPMKRLSAPSGKRIRTPRFSVPRRPRRTAVFRNPRGGERLHSRVRGIKGSIFMNLPPTSTAFPTGYGRAIPPRRCTPPWRRSWPALCGKKWVGDTQRQEVFL